MDQVIELIRSTKPLNELPNVVFLAFKATVMQTFVLKY